MERLVRGFGSGYCHLTTPQRTVTGSRQTEVEPADSALPCVFNKGFKG